MASSQGLTPWASAVAGRKRTAAAASEAMASRRVVGVMGMLL